MQDPIINANVSTGIYVIRYPDENISIHIGRLFEERKSLWGEITVNADNPPLGWQHIHMPSARFAANGAWLAVQVMAHNLARWTARIGLGERTVITKTLRRRVFALVGRITRSARCLTLHLPRRWPWETQFSRALARLHAIPFPA